MCTTRIRLGLVELKIRRAACPGSGCELNVYTAARQIIIITKPHGYNVILWMPEYNQVLPIASLARSPSLSPSLCSTVARPLLLLLPPDPATSPPHPGGHMARGDQTQHDTGVMKCDNDCFIFFSFFLQKSNFNHLIASTWHLPHQDVAVGNVVPCSCIDRGNLRPSPSQIKRICLRI